MSHPVYRPYVIGFNSLPVHSTTELDRLADLALLASRQLKRLAYAGKLAQSANLPLWQELQDLALSVQSQLAAKRPPMPR